jgi:NDP-sugar pyrophosphorylase family protein
MVLAAGLGTRLKPYTDLVPKPLVPLLGVPCIDYSLMQLPTAGVDEVVVNVHAHSSQLVDHLHHASIREGLKIRISDESSLLLGSAGGYRKALSLLESTPGVSEPFFALNADVVSTVNLRALAARHAELRKTHDVWMTLCIASGTMLASQEGAYTEIFLDDSTGLVSGIGAKKSNVPFYTGTAVFETACFRHLGEGIPSEFVPEVLLPLIAQGKVGFFRVDQLWLDVGSPLLWWKSHFELKKAMDRGSVPANWIRATQDRSSEYRLLMDEGIVDYDPSLDRPDRHDRNWIRYRGVMTDV